jgi:hypothetical protein
VTTAPTGIEGVHGEGTTPVRLIWNAGRGVGVTLGETVDVALADGVVLGDGVAVSLAVGDIVGDALPVAVALGVPVVGNAVSLGGTVGLAVGREATTNTVPVNVLDPAR